MVKLATNGIDPDAEITQPLQQHALVSLRPKRRYNERREAETTREEALHLPEAYQSPSRHRMKRSGQPHRVYPAVLAAPPIARKPAATQLLDELLGLFSPRS